MGRVQTPTLGFIVEKELERDNHVPKKYHSVSVPSNGIEMNVRFHESDDPDAWLDETETEAPAEVHEYFDHIADLKKNNAVFVNVDGTVSDAVGPSKLAAAADDADGAVAIVINGAVSDRILDIASEAAIETVVGTKEGKGFSKRDDVKAWLSEKHA